MSSLPAFTEPPTAVVEPVAEDGRRVSETAYWRDYYLESDIHYEWNGGRLEEKPMSDYETYLVYAWFTELLRHFLRIHPMASMVALEMGFRLPLSDKTVIRKPDLGVVRQDNPQPLLPLDCSYHGVFDLCIEALSDKEPSGIERDTVTKKAEYAQGGVAEYYILHREQGRRRFFSRNALGVYVPMASADGVVRSTVLPGFQFRVDDLGRRPELEAMRDDPVYREFVLPGWRQAERMAHDEAQAREQAEQRAGQEAKARRAAEEEIERLRALLEQRDQHLLSD